MLKYKALVLGLTIMVLSCSETEVIPTPVPKRYLSHFTDSFLVNGSLESQNMTTFSYNEQGRITKYVESVLNTESQEFDEQRHFLFTYTADRVSAIEGFETGAEVPYTELTYLYLDDGRVSKISEQNFVTGVVNEATFDYMDDVTTKVTYSTSNHTSFDYIYTMKSNNLETFTLTKGGETCSAGSYTYDGMRNPLFEQGYVDFFLRNISLNNRLSEDVDYLACAFPDLVIETYEYTYDESDYPLLVETNYTSGTIKMRREYIYK